MISSYRLGDLILLELGENEKNEILNDYPFSIGTEYIKRYIPNTKPIDLISNIVLNYIEKYKNLIPSDIEQSTVLHIRLGDVIKGNEFHEKEKRPLSIEYLKKNIPTNDKIYVIGKCFSNCSRPPLLCHESL
jgi:hypothetical protein